MDQHYIKILKFADLKLEVASFKDISDDDILDVRNIFEDVIDLCDIVCINDSQWRMTNDQIGFYLEIISVDDKNNQILINPNSLDEDDDYDSSMLKNAIRIYI